MKNGWKPGPTDLGDVLGMDITDMRILSLMRSAVLVVTASSFRQLWFDSTFLIDGMQGSFQTALHYFFFHVIGRQKAQSRQRWTFNWAMGRPGFVQSWIILVEGSDHIN
ncbi:hypothetical protein RRG08_036574 [Elysia crispata]|uniref:Uncharacterized protein n=1 Tax=Elysia crispata TaxID=231223 RepID=A0AAE0ZQX1_9GAST|nr:hypothetical protein RRG08_036574 [Elysia crispata]